MAIDSTQPLSEDELRKLINQAARGRRTKLDLSGNQLTMLPPEIAQLQFLQLLDLSRNQLTTLPPEIIQLQSLRSLSLSGNQLTTLPPEIIQLQSLQSLSLNGNQLTTLPPEIIQLQSLRSLSLSGNQLTTLPPEIIQLQSLQQLDLSGNQLTMLPPEIIQLQSLQLLDLSGNQLTTLPPEIIQLQSLQSLDLSRNQLTTLPPEIAQLQSLRSLSLSGNQLTTLPPEIAQLQKLEELFLHDNPALLIAPEVLGATWLEVLFDDKRPADPAEILNYYFSLQTTEQRQPLNEAKVLLVGQGSVGKTSLVRRLVSEQFNPHENKTEGINITQWPIEAKGQTIQLNIWDFGGQEIMHATHQFFLTKRSLYVLVLDARLGEDENRLEYWLKIIQSFGSDSPIIVVGNKIDQQPLDIDKRGLRRKYPSIVAIVETCCADGRGIEKLRTTICKEIAKLDHVFDPLAQSWFNVKRCLENMQRDYIEYSEYRDLCQKENITDQLTQTTLIKLLHRLGVILSFQDDPRLQMSAVLNPEWVTNGVYRILNDNPLMTEHKGILDRQMLDHMLDANTYPPDKHLFILDMMKKFELCFPLEGYADQKFLIPDLISKEEPETGEWSDALPFQYHYNVLPSSVISRFIVRMNQLISRYTYWRSGVVLERSSNKALIKADREEKIIFIWVKGNPARRRSLLESIRDQFYYIHSTIPGIEAEEKVPLPERPEVLVDYKHLLDLEALGEAEFVPPGLREKVSVRRLLDGIEAPEERQVRQNRLAAQRQDASQMDQPEPLPPMPAPTSEPPRRNFYTSGAFTLVSYFAITILLVVVSRLVSWYMVPVIIIGAILSVGVIGAFQLSPPEGLTQENFLTLMIESYKRLPLLRGDSRQSRNSNDESNSN
ncbi:MAG: COR domain-containing protein [Thainema sp.]